MISSRNQTWARAGSAGCALVSVWLGAQSMAGCLPGQVLHMCWVQGSPQPTGWDRCNFIVIVIAYGPLSLHAHRVMLTAM